MQFSYCLRSQGAMFPGVCYLVLTQVALHWAKLYLDTVDPAVCRLLMLPLSSVGTASWSSSSLVNEPALIPSSGLGGRLRASAWLR